VESIKTLSKYPPQRGLGDARLTLHIQHRFAVFAKSFFYICGNINKQIHAKL
jgi:hypothetical protein